MNANRKNLDQLVMASSQGNNHNSEIIEAYQNMIQARMNQSQPRFHKTGGDTQAMNKSAYAFGGVSSMNALRPHNSLVE